MKALTLCSTLVVGTLVGTVGFAQDDVDPAIKARHAHMSLYAYNLGTLGDMAKGETEYDAAIAQAAADRLVALSDMSQEGYYPEGTSSEDVEASRALPRLWDERDNYETLTGELNDAAVTMASSAGDGVEAVQGNMQALGQSCGACHELYRMSDD